MAAFSRRQDVGLEQEAASVCGFENRIWQSILIAFA